MTEQTVSEIDDRLLTGKEVAARLGISTSVLAQRRKNGKAPAYNSVLRGYMLSSVLAFEAGEQEFKEKDGGLVSRDELASRWGIGIRALQKREVAGKAPAKVKIGCNIYYRLNDIVAIEQTSASA